MLLNKFKQLKAASFNIYYIFKDDISRGINKYAVLGQNVEIDGVKYTLKAVIRKEK